MQIGMNTYQDSEEIPDKNQELYYTLCPYIRKYLNNTHQQNHVASNR